MLIKEYRIPLPLTRDEYRIAQLYMIAKKSREESHGEDSGIEILVNEPYADGPGPDGKGQYTRKVYHVGSHLPSWVKSLIPKSALSVEEEAWNAYPYTKTRFTCPFLEKFNIEVETYYFNDGGHQDNVFDLTKPELKQREVDIIDVVRDQLYGGDYVEAEDPRIFQSLKTKRGPLDESWIDDYWAECEGKPTPLPNGHALMCAYKLCKVEFRYWGMQTKIEKFIHDVALRKTMLRAHRQAWAWIDEWWGLTIENIRDLERETQAHLAAQYNQLEKEDTSNPDHSSDEEYEGELEGRNANAPILGRERLSSKGETVSTSSERTLTDDIESGKLSDKSRGDCGLSLRDNGSPKSFQMDYFDERKRLSYSRSTSKNTLSAHSQASWRMESIRRDSVSSGSDEFFDCQEDLYISEQLPKWSSLELIPQNSGRDMRKVAEEFSTGTDDYHENTSFPHPSMNIHPRFAAPLFSSLRSSPSQSPQHVNSCPTSVLLIVLHGGSVLDSVADSPPNKKSDLLTFRGSFESVIRHHYRDLSGRVSIRIVNVLSVCGEILGVISRLSPYGLDSNIDSSCENIPVAALPIFGTISSEYENAVTRAITDINSTYSEFIKSDEGKNFNGQICFIGDSVGGLVAYDALCWGPDAPPSPGSDTGIPCINRPHLVSESSTGDENVFTRNASDSELHYNKSSKSSNIKHSQSGESSQNRFEFEVSDLFLFGCPIALVLIYRKMISPNEKFCSQPRRPMCNQVYNLFHPTDPLAMRLEPLLSAGFSFLPPVVIPRHATYPLGDGNPLHLLECIQTHSNVFLDNPTGSPCIARRRVSDASIMSNVSGLAENVSLSTINNLTYRWWGQKRIDYALYCPEGLSNFPSNVLPHLFHASYWESQDVIAFIIRQLLRDNLRTSSSDEKEMSVFLPNQPREKWQKKRTSVKIKNIAANHRANDIMVLEGNPQIVSARFLYGPLDMITLSGEKVDLHIMKDPPTGDWQYFAMSVTDKSGKVNVNIPPDKALSCGVYPAKLIVRGDHTSCSLHICVVPPHTECVVFSIDGSFTASMSVTGRDPKVRPGAVDVVRHWQELGYLILYITGRPDMQQHKVVNWLANHNFPLGLVSFADGLSTNPLGHKEEYLRTTVKECDVSIEAAYGSAKDISVYSSIGLTPEKIFIVGKVSKKQQPLCEVLHDGYAAHLSQLTLSEKSRPARTHPEMVIPRRVFGLMGHGGALRRRRSAKRTTSHPVIGSDPTEGLLHSGRVGNIAGSFAYRTTHLSLKS